MTFGLAVASADGEPAERVVLAQWAGDLDPTVLAAADRCVDLDASETSCPACGTAFAPSEPRCPGCGLRFG